MFGWFNQDKLQAKATPLARALRDQYGAGAVEVCRAALTRPELIGERRRVIQLALHMLDGSFALAEPVKSEPRALIAGLGDPLSAGDAG